MVCEVVGKCWSSASKCWSMTNKPSLTSTSWAPCTHLGNATGDSCSHFSELGEQVGLAQLWRGWWDWPKRLNWHYMCLHYLCHIFWFKQSLRWCNALKWNFVLVARANNNILRWLKNFKTVQMAFPQTPPDPHIPVPARCTQERRWHWHPVLLILSPPHHDHHGHGWSETGICIRDVHKKIVSLLV